MATLFGLSQGGSKIGPKTKDWAFWLQNLSHNQKKGVQKPYFAILLLFDTPAKVRYYGFSTTSGPPRTAEEESCCCCLLLNRQKQRNRNGLHQPCRERAVQAPCCCGQWQQRTNRLWWTSSLSNLHCILFSSSTQACTLPTGRTSGAILKQILSIPPPTTFPHHMSACFFLQPNGTFPRVALR